MVSLFFLPDKEGKGGPEFSNVPEVTENSSNLGSLSHTLALNSWDTASFFFLILNLFFKTESFYFFFFKQHPFIISQFPCVRGLGMA